MSALKEFLKTTIIGGLMFLVPVILIVVILSHAMRLAAKIAAPIAERFATTQIAGVAVVTIVAALVLLILSTNTAPAAQLVAVLFMENAIAVFESMFDIHLH